MGSQGGRGELSDMGTAKQSTILLRLGVMGNTTTATVEGDKVAEAQRTTKEPGGKRGRSPGATWEVAQRVRYKHDVIWGARSEREAAAREARQPRHSVGSPIPNGYKVWSSQASTRGTVQN